MKNYTLTELCKENFDVDPLTVCKQFWDATDTFSCLGEPKKQNNLLYLDGCRGKYTLKNGAELTAESGDVVYAPQGAEYAVTFYDFAPGGCTIGINFFLRDAEDSLLFSENVKIFKNESRLRLLFEEMENLSRDFRTLPLQNKIGLLRILQALYSSVNKAEYPVIQKGVNHLNRYYADNEPVSRLAALCNVSEVYFRRLFKAQTGLSPTEYRTKLKLEKARQYLEYGDVSVREISEILGYSTVSHFIKQFKQFFGQTPVAYRNSKLGR